MNQLCKPLYQPPCPIEGLHGEYVSSVRGSPALFLAWFPLVPVQQHVDGCKHTRSHFVVALLLTGSLPCISVPSGALQLLSGYTPDLQLLATLETLWHRDGPSDTGPCHLLAAIATSWQEDPSKAPPPDSPMWLALASMAVGVRRQATLMVFPPPGSSYQVEPTTKCFGALLPLLQMAVVAVQQPGAGWGALVLGSAVQGAALACCVMPVVIAAGAVTSMANPLLVHADAHTMLQCSRQTVAHTAAFAAGVGQALCDVLPCWRQQHTAPAAGGAPGAQEVAQDGGDEAPPPGSTTTAAATGAVSTATTSPPPAAAAAGAPSATEDAAGPDRLCRGPSKRVNQLIETWHKWLPVTQNLLLALHTSWPVQGAAAVGAPHVPRPTAAPRSDTAAAGAAAAVARALADNWTGGDPAAHSMLQRVVTLMEVCDMAAQCARACGTTPQLLGCAHLGCTTPPPGGLASCEASLGVNRKGSVCGGCGVVRYCSPACAQRDWPEHRRVCRRLRAAVRPRSG
jgi:hypothetical protein